MLYTYMAELTPETGVRIEPSEPKAVFVPNNEAQTMLLAYYWAEHSPAGQIDFFTVGKILDLAGEGEDNSWLENFCMSDSPERVWFDVDTDNDEITDLNILARLILFKLQWLRDIIYEHEEEIRAKINT